MNRLIISLIFFYLTISCSANLKYVKEADQLEFDLMVKSPIYLTPSIDQVEEYNFQKAEYLLRTIFHNNRPYYRTITPKNYLGTVIKNPAYLRAVKMYQDKGVIRVSDLLTMGSLLKHSYMIFTRLDEVTEVQKVKDIKDKKKTVREMWTTKTLQGTFSLFDIDKGKLLFDAKHSIEISKVTYFTKFHHLKKYNEGPPRYPKISAKQLSRKLFEAFVNKLPKRGY